MFTASARTPVRSLGTGDDGERRASSPFLSSSGSLLRPAGKIIIIIIIILIHFMHMRTICFRFPTTGKCRRQYR